MADNVTNDLLLEHLKAIQAKLASMDERIGGLNAEVLAIKAHIAGFHAERSGSGQRHRIAARQPRVHRTPA